MKCPVCLEDIDCDDPAAPNGGVCTDDDCEDFVCYFYPNYDPAYCCNPDTGELILFEDEDECTDDICNGDGSVDHVLNYDPTTYCCCPICRWLTLLDDGNECTEDVCGVISPPHVEALHKALDGTPCDDGDPCTVEDTCVDGECIGVLQDSDGDGVPDCVDVCPGVDDNVFAPGSVGAIPTVSEWGLVILALLLLVAAKVYFSRRRELST